MYTDGEGEEGALPPEGIIYCEGGRDPQNEERENERERERGRGGDGVDIRVANCGGLMIWLEQQEKLGDVTAVCSDGCIKSSVLVRH